MDILFIYPSTTERNISNVAAYTRLINLAKLCVSAGANVTIASITTREEKDYLCDCVRYKAIPICRLAKYRRMFVSIFFTDLIVKYLSEEGKIFSIVCIYGGYCTAGLPLLRAQKKFSFKLGFVINDWLQLNTPSFAGKVNIFLGRNLVYCRMAFGITISGWLSSKYVGRMPLLKIPALMNGDAFLEPALQPVGKPVRIAYAGNIAGRKDYVDNAIRALPHIDKDLLDSLEIHLFGAKREQLTQQLGQDAALLQEYAHKVIFHGFMPQEQLRKALATMDYTMLFRPDLPYTRAGFANKFAESLAMGVPVIANITGDMAGYLRDGQEGIIAKSERPQDIALSFTRAISVAAQEHENMRKRAYEMARKSFWIENYKDDIEAFLCLLEDRREQS